MRISWQDQKNKITDGVRRNFYVKTWKRVLFLSAKVKMRAGKIHTNSPPASKTALIRIVNFLKPPAQFRLRWNEKGKKGGYKKVLPTLASLFGGIAVFTHGWTVSRGSSPLGKKFNVQNRSADSEQGVWRLALVDWIINCLRVYPCWNFFGRRTKASRKKPGLLLTA